MGRIKFTMLFNCLLCFVFHSGIHCSFCQDQPENPKQLQVALFDVDATPPVGSLLAYDPMEKRDDLGLRAKGIIIVGSGLPVVLCAIDWIGIANESQDAFKLTLAEAASTLPSRVAVHTVHQHDAPISDWGAEKILKGVGLDPKAFESSFDKVLLDRLSEAIGKSMENLQPVSHIGTGKALVHQVASNRRIAGPDGKIIHSRTSSTKDPKIRAYPEGLIDPEVSLVSFWNGEMPIAVLSYYAVHPQSYYLTKIANPDFPGIARYLRQLAVPTALHVHFNGAGANITAGKYNDGSWENRLILAERLAKGMKEAWENTEKQPITSQDVQWQQLPVLLPADDKVKSIASEMYDKDARWLTNNMQKLAWYNRQALGKKIEVSALTLGNARILHLPGELFVEYQLAAKNENPDIFVAMAAYGDYGPFYIGTETAYEEGGYEIGASPVTAESEQILMGAIRKLMGNSPPSLQENHPMLTQNKERIRYLYQWEQKRKDWKKNMTAIMGPLPQEKSKNKSEIRFLDTLVTDEYNRYQVVFPSDEKNEVSAYLYLPHGDQNSPAMLILHPTGDLGKKIVDGEGPLENRALAREMAIRGYVVMAPDYPSFGDQLDHDFSTDGFASGTMLAIWNHIRCVDVLSGLKKVDKARIGVMGHSLGGHNALFAAAFDERLKLVVSSCGWTPFDFYDIGEEGSKRYGGRLGPWAQDRYMPNIKTYLPDGKLPFDFTDIIATIAPRPLFTNAPLRDANFDVKGVKSAIKALRPVYEFMGFPDHLQVRYPDAGHDFPDTIRKEAYQFIDDHFGFVPKKKLDFE